MTYGISGMSVLINKSNPTGVDMSPQAIDKRLREVSGLYELYRKLKTAKQIGPAEDIAQGNDDMRDEHPSVK